MGGSLSAVSEKSIHEFTVKVCVNGQNAAPVYRFLKSKKPTFFGTRIKWNFTKFLVGKDGQVIDRYGSTVPPLSIEKDIMKAYLEMQEMLIETLMETQRGS